MNHAARKVNVRIMCDEKFMQISIQRETEFFDITFPVVKDTRFSYEKGIGTNFHSEDLSLSEFCDKFKTLFFDEKLKNKFK